MQDRVHALAFPVICEDPSQQWLVRYSWLACERRSYSVSTDRRLLQALGFTASIVTAVSTIGKCRRRSSDEAHMLAPHTVPCYHGRKEFSKKGRSGESSASPDCLACAVHFVSVPAGDSGASFCTRLEASAAHVVPMSLSKTALYLLSASSLFPEAS